MSLINKSQVRKYALWVAGEKRKLASTGKPRFTRVSADFFADVESQLRVTISLAVERAPSKGRTL